MSPVIATAIPKKKAKKKTIPFLDIIKFPNRDFNLAATAPERNFSVSGKYKLLDTVEILRWFHKNKAYAIRNVLAGQPDTRYDQKKFVSDRNYKRSIENKRRSKQHFVRISDAEVPGNSQMEVLILNSHDKKCKLRIILSITSMIQSKNTPFVSVKAIYGFAEFKHEDVSERKLDDILKEFWDKERPAAYELKEKMSATIPGSQLLELCQELATIRITKNSPALSAKEMMDEVQREFGVITYDALYQTAVRYVRAKNMIRYVKIENGSIWGLQKEIKIAMAVLDVFKQYLSK